MIRNRSYFRLWIIVIILLISSLACALDLSQFQPAEDPEVAFETQVAELVNEQKGKTQPEGENDPTQAAETAIAENVETSVPVENTLLPSDTPMITATNTQAATATLLADDPSLVLGDPDWQDTFDNANNWTEFDVTFSKVDISGGYLYMTAKDKDGGSRWTVTWRKVKDYYMEVEAETPAVCAGLDRYGLLVRAPDTSSGYILEFSCDGKYRFWKWDGSDADVFIKWTGDSAINSGPNKVNRVGVLVEGEDYKLYANGKLLGEFSNPDYNEENRFGLVVAAKETNSITIKFDNLKYWLLP